MWFKLRVTVRNTAGTEQIFHNLNDITIIMREKACNNPSRRQYKTRFVTFRGKIPPPRVVCRVVL